MQLLYHLLLLFVIILPTGDEDPEREGNKFHGFPLPRNEAQIQIQPQQLNSAYLPYKLFHATIHVHTLPWNQFLQVGGNTEEYETIVLTRHNDK